MKSSAPDSCSLSPAELDQRLEFVRAAIARHVMRRELLPDGCVWELPASEELRGQIERWIELEAECCGPALKIRLSETNEHLRLEVRGLEPRMAAQLARLDDAS